MAPKGTLAPNQFTVLLSESDYNRFTAIEDELVSELESVAQEHAGVEHYVFLGPVTVTMEADPDLTPGMVLVSGEMVKPPDVRRSRLVLADGRTVALEGKSVVIGRMPDCAVVLTDPNVSRYHAEVRPVPTSGGPTTEYEVSDMGSTNGTKLNGVKLPGAQTLREGDTITVGASSIRFERA